MSVTSIRIEEDLDKALESASSDMKRPKSWIINQALRAYLKNRELEDQYWQDTL